MRGGDAAILCFVQEGEQFVDFVARVGVLLVVVQRVVFLVQPRLDHHFFFVSHRCFFFPRAQQRPGRGRRSRVLRFEPVGLPVDAGNSQIGSGHAKVGFRPGGGHQDGRLVLIIAVGPPPDNLEARLRSGRPLAAHHRLTGERRPQQGRRRRRRLALETGRSVAAIGVHQSKIQHGVNWWCYLV